MAGRPGMALTVMAVMIAALVAAGMASAVTVNRNLTKASVTLQNGSLPPPGGKAHTTRYTTAGQLARMTSALSADHIAKRTAVANRGCAGGTDVKVVLYHPSGRAIALDSYLCGGRTYGNTAGNVAGFLKRLGLSLP